MEMKDAKRVVVVGAGTMGHGIAQVFAQGGLEVGLVDTDPEILDHALRKAASSLELLAEHGMLPEEEVDLVLQRIHPTTNLEEALRPGADFVIEAVFEVPDLKREIFEKLESLTPADTILASNTSSLDIFGIVRLKDPRRLVVAHWFAPPQIIPLVEVVPGPLTSPDAVKFTASLLSRLGKRPVVMSQFVPGFIVNRIQFAIIQAVLEMLEKGWATPEEIDLAVKTSLGVRLPVVGVVQSLDFTGLRLVRDIELAAGRKSAFLETKVSQGHLGASTSRGIYDYGGRSEQEILRKRDRLYLQMLRHLETIKAFEPV